MSNPFGPLGAWLRRQIGSEELVRISRELEELGYGTVWISGGRDPGVFELVEAVLDATTEIKVGTGIVNIWVETPASVTEAFHRIEAKHPGRLYAGLGISHAPLVESLHLDYRRPVATTEAFLDGLDEQPEPVPHDRLLLAALGPRMLALAAERTLGTHPYLVTADNTAAARAGSGDKVVAPELGVVLEPDLALARVAGREALSYYLGLPNYTNNWKRSGFTDEDLAGGGSDRLLDAVLALGDADAIAARVAEHRAAGADHIALQVLGASDQVPTFRALAGLR